MGQSPTSCQVSGLSAHADGDGVFVAEFQLEMVKWGSWAWRGLHVSKGSAKAVHFHQNIIRYTSLYHIYMYTYSVYTYTAWCTCKKNILYNTYVCQHFLGHHSLLLLNNRYRESVDQDQRSGSMETKSTPYI